MYELQHRVSTHRSEVFGTRTFVDEVHACVRMHACAYRLDLRADDLVDHVVVLLEAAYVRAVERGERRDELLHRRWW